MRTLLKAVVLLGAVAGPLSAQQINLLPGGGTVGSWGSFGGGAGADWGQSFTSPVGYNELDQFTFFFKGNGAGLPFRAYVATYNGVIGSAGTILFQSALTFGVNSTNLVPFVFNTGGVAVTAGSKYFAFVDASPYVAAGGGAVAMSGEYSTFAGGGYAGGDFMYNNGINGNFTNTQTTGWVPKGDLVFNATFSNSVVATPEPATLGLLATGLVGLAGVARRKRGKIA